jgi:hypothetical protein
VAKGVGDLLEVRSSGENSIPADKAEYLEGEDEKGREIDQAESAEKKPPGD